MTDLKYKRVLLKLSGEAFAGDGSGIIDIPSIRAITCQIKNLFLMGVQVAIVVGAGNIWRGATVAREGIDRVTADYAGMLATVINALALQDMLEKEGVMTRTQSAITVQQVAEPFIRRRAIRHLEKGRVVIFAGGTGNPYMTTDTAAALRAVEIGAEVLLMAKNRVDGIYDSDPRRNPKARRLESLTHEEAMRLKPEVMDATAFALCFENKIPIIVFDIRAKDSIERAVSGEPIGSRVRS